MVITNMVRARNFERREYMKRELARIEQDERDVRTVLPQIIPAALAVLTASVDGYACAFGQYPVEIRYTIPWIVDVAETMHRHLVAFGWEHSHTSDTTYHEKPDRFIRYVHPAVKNYKVIINMESSRKGSCRLVITGYETVERPIYQVQCEEFEYAES